MDSCNIAPQSSALFPRAVLLKLRPATLSFKKAAVELCLTQSAISHQIKSLEDYLGVQLFYRETRAVVLTDEGSSYLNGMSAILDSMATETARISKREMRGLTFGMGGPWFSAMAGAASLGVP